MTNKLLLAALAVMTVAGSISPANADDWRYRHDRMGYGYRHAYVAPMPAYAYQPQPVYVNRHQRRWIRHHEYVGARPYRTW
jgi:hypothetical protein